MLLVLRIYENETYYNTIITIIHCFVQDIFHISRYEKLLNNDYLKIIIEVFYIEGNVFIINFSIFSKTTFNGFELHTKSSKCHL